MSSVLDDIQKKADDFTIKIQKLQEYMGTYDEKLEVQEKSPNVMRIAYLAGTILPIVFFIGLLIFKPEKWMHTEKNGAKRRNLKKMFWSSVLFAIAVWLCIAIYYYVF